MSGFLNKHAGDKVDSPFAKKQKATETKPVKLNADLHYKIKLYAAKEGTGVTITDIINEAVSDYIEKNDIEKTIKNE